MPNRFWWEPGDLSPVSGSFAEQRPRIIRAGSFSGRTSVRLTEDNIRAILAGLTHLGDYGAPVDEDLIFVLEAALRTLKSVGERQTADSAQK